MQDINQLKIENKMTSLEVPKDIYITSDGFTMENNLLTPTFKLKRNIAREYYRTQIDEMYTKLAA
jgi:long-chain acyl-CoA synthetase